MNSDHFTDIVGIDCLSKTTTEQLHNLVNTSKAFLENGYTSYGRSFHCCFCLDHGKVREVGFNSYKYQLDYHPILGRVKKYAEPSYKMCKHAEIDAILKLGNIDFSKIMFFNTHIDKNMHCKNSKPCLNCLRMMRIVGVRKIAYYDEDAKKFLVLKI